MTDDDDKTPELTPEQRAARTAEHLFRLRQTILIGAINGMVETWRIQVLNRPTNAKFALQTLRECFENANELAKLPAYGRSADEGIA